MVYNVYVHISMTDSSFLLIFLYIYICRVILVRGFEKSQLIYLLHNAKLYLDIVNLSHQWILHIVVHHVDSLPSFPKQKKINLQLVPEFLFPGFFPWQKAICLNYSH